MWKFPIRKILNKTEPDPENRIIDINGQNVFAHAPFNASQALMYGMLVTLKLEINDGKNPPLRKNDRNDRNDNPTVSASLNYVTFSKCLQKLSVN